MARGFFAVIRQAAPPIHVFDKGIVTVLEPQEIDARCEDQRYSEGVTESYTEGDGSQENPYCYLSAAPVSPHYAIVDLWSRFGDKDVWIEVSGWLLKLSPEGVTATDGHFTKLI